MGFIWAWVPPTWVQVPSRVLAGFESQPHGFESQTRFWLGSGPSHMGLSPKLGFGWVWVPAHGFKSQSEVNGFTFKMFSLSLFSLDYCDVFRFGEEGCFMDIPQSVASFWNTLWFGILLCEVFLQILNLFYSSPSPLALQLCVHWDFYYVLNVSHIFHPFKGACGGF